MKLTCDTAKLRDVLQLIQPVCPQKTTLPILTNVLLRAQSNSLEFTVSDLELSIKTSIEAEVVAPGETTIPIKVFLEAIRRIKNKTVELFSNENNVLKITGSASMEILLNGLPASDFPTFSNLIDCNTIDISGATLSRMIKHTSYAVSTDESRRSLTGVCFSFGKVFDMVATDGRRLSKYTAKDISCENAVQIIVPIKAIGLINQICYDKEKVTLKYSSNQIEITGEKTTLITRLIDGKYPNYEQVIPKNSTYGVDFNRQEFSDIISLSRICVDKNSNPTVKLSFSNNKMEMSAFNTEIGSIKEQLPIEFSGDSFDIAFNSTYLLDLCSNLEEKAFIMNIIDSGSPSVIKAGDNFVCVLMPMRL